MRNAAHSNQGKQIQLEPSNSVRPLLRWAGSKLRSLPEMSPYFPQVRDRYIELFAGSACLFFHLAPKRAVLVDNNVSLIEFYRVATDDPEGVFRRFIRLPRNPETYYRIRRAFPSEKDPLRRAAHFLYLNRNCFNGIYRTNNQGGFNVPFSKDRVANYPTRENFILATNILTKAKLRCGDFEHACEMEAKRGDFIYLDPPYYRPRKRVFREYSSKPFSNEDIDRLECLLREIDQTGARFLLSYPECAIAKRLAAQWNRKRINVRRTIAGSVAARGPTKELLIFNYDVTDA
ncbi:Dam family site-specific DNA-(adenine-N6)-methyltransferase [Bradyrhizobium sp. th.b2]|uniref:DNA adenine methylase n=1 Tax=Bradyrhizobium sp. th-b2 TaxID=172088 RepID=UPI000A03790D|nr:Dam family site-specific DNA-(adenine-N6)-methyltransferase [Bradyrhizobium sp. th.b2]